MVGLNIILYSDWLLYKCWPGKAVNRTAIRITFAAGNRAFLILI